MRKALLIGTALILVFAGIAFARHRKNKDTESPRLVLPAASQTAATAPSAASASAPATTSSPAAAPAETGYWLNTKSHIRHNKSCRYYGKGKNGRPCSADEGRPCKVCGG